ncbi:ABC transporter permease [Brenneria goodwinii]|uniref:ABC transporter permease n=1 Tax=Brenneria goodwinii TaxID=1109412 RepID=UPI000EF1EB74|nr:ABC transporter permease [Brenneria goodwinii]MCG8158796.1 ABC transporter permease [Brenneria goodwinii]MCG8163401.1 ABC transporter permease [Brenneria goodwinii]MCG8167925.1 ABC transporter permease [Brenneria goodwinii]MCG8172552.1 ABC transporter permease [Brenneria goodwinii]MCG8177254.1 ABC transporter permease [Brenneria goodwinii]
MNTAKRLWRNTSVKIGVLTLATLALLGIGAPWLGTFDPSVMDMNFISVGAGTRGQVTLLDGVQIPHTFWMGSDSLGRDIWSRVLYGTRISLAVGLLTALAAILAGCLLGMLAGYFRALDMLLMRIMDGLMAIPSVLVAITLVAMFGGNLTTVIIAIAVPEVPRVTRLVRSLVLSLRQEAFVEAARALATSNIMILWRDILPNAMAPLIVQGTFVAASAVLTEAILSFLGLGLPSDIPTWGNIMAEGRVMFSQSPGDVLFPALFLVPSVLAINLLGDGLRDVLDPKFSKRL